MIYTNIYCDSLWTATTVAPVVWFFLFHFHLTTSSEQEQKGYTNQHQALVIWTRIAVLKFYVFNLTFIVIMYYLFCGIWLYVQCITTWSWILCLLPCCRKNSKRVPKVRNGVYAQNLSCYLLHEVSLCLLHWYNWIKLVYSRLLWYLHM